MGRNNGIAKSQYFIRRSFVIGYVIALALICFFAWYTYYNMKRVEFETFHETQILKSIKSLETVYDDIQEMESNQRGYIISGNKAFLESYTSAANRLTTDTLQLKESLQQKGELAQLPTLLGLIRQKVEFMGETIQIRDEQGYEAAFKRIQSDYGRQWMQTIRYGIAEVEDALKVQLGEFGERRRNAARNTTELFIILSVLFFVFLLTFFFLERADIQKRFKTQVAKEVDKGIVDFKDILERINDGFIALDKDWNYVYLNKAASIVGSKESGKLIGRNIWQLYPDEVGSDYYKAWHKSMETQQYIMMESYYQKWDRWFENHIYPSPRGVSVYFKDITEKKKTELKLQEVKERFNIVAKATNDILWEADLVKNTLWLNENFFEKFGYTDRSKFSGSSAWEENLHPGDKERVVTNILYLMNETDQPIWTDSYRYLKADGTYLDIYDRCYIIRDANGKPTKLIGSMTDVSSLFRAREELTRKEEQYRTLVEQATDGIFIADQSGRFLVVNSSGCSMSMYSHAELLNMTIFDLAVESDIRDNPFDFEKMNNPGGARTERKLKKKDGSIIDVEVNAKYLSDGRFLAFIRDITERKKAEVAIRTSARQLELIYNTTSDILFLISVEPDDRFIVQSVNRMFGTVTGLTNSEVIGKDIRDIIPSTYVSMVLSNYNAAMRQKQTISWEEVSEFPSGVKTGVVSITPFLNEKGECTQLVGSIHDITERKKAEDAIVRSNERFELIARTTNEALWEWEFGTNRAWGNETHQRLYGLTPDDPIPDHNAWKGRIHPEDREKVISSYKNALSSGDTKWLAEYRFRSAENETSIIYDRTYIQRDKDGTPVRMMGSMMDITDLKKAEQEISKGKDLADKLINSMPGVFYFFDQEGKFIRWNEQMETVTGYSGEEIAEMHPTDFFGGADKAYIADRIMGVFENGVNDAEADFVTKDGNHIPYYFKGVLINYEGRPCLVGSGIDISERLKAEQGLRVSEKKYRSLVEQAADAIFIFNEKGEFIDVNDVSAQLLGYDRDELKGMTLESILFNTDLVADPVLLDALASGESLIKRRNFRKKDGSAVPVEVHSKKLVDGNYLGMVRDLTERIEAEKQLQESYRQIRELTDHLQHIREEERSHIAREIHDELGQQLTVLKMDVSWLNKKVALEDEPVKRKLKSLTEMLDGTVKTVRRISSELRPSVLDDLGLVAAVEWHLKEFERRAGIKTSFQEPESELEINETIKTGLFRIFQESLTNVARHASATKVKVDLLEKNGYILLRIEDDGKGFNKLQVHNKRTLGILGMKERTAMMGGTYVIESNPGQGTIVVVSVPLQL